MMPFPEDGSDGGRLIFLVSQPRSGSTLLQHILGSHPQIHTVAEPWLMLPLVYALRETGAIAEYNARYASLALKGFLRDLKAGEEEYWRAVRMAAAHLYETVLEGTGKRFFLDKTPRYYFILHELRRIFPQARFILLVRHPLAVFASILHVSLQGDLRGFLSADRRHDILTAPRMMAEALRFSGGLTAVVRYEELATCPNETVRRLCEQIALDYDPDIVDYGGKVRLKGTFVDPKSIYRHAGPVDDYVNAWPQYLDAPEKREAARAYLRLLGQDLVGELGYSYRDIEAALDRLPRRRAVFRVPWERLLTEDGLPLRDRLALSCSGAFGNRMARRLLRYYKRARDRTGD